MKNENRFKEYFGMMTFPEIDFDTLPFILINDKDNNGEGYVFNVTEYLKNNQGKRIGLVINKYGKDIFCEVGKIDVINEVYMVNGRDVCRALWYNTKKLLRIVIDTEPDMENMEAES